MLSHHSFLYFYAHCTLGIITRCSVQIQLTYSDGSIEFKHTEVEQ